MVMEGERGSALCLQLSISEADRLFFPGSGGSPKKANAFCSRCDIREECLREAIEFKYEGFYAGFTKEERLTAARHFSITPVGLDAIMPPEPSRKRRVYRKIVTEVQDTLSFLDTVTSPLDIVGP